VRTVVVVDGVGVGVVVVVVDVVWGSWLNC
jgi:hypothetical protein